MVVRKFPRFPVTMPSTLIQKDKLRYNASLKDLSLNGCRVESIIRPFTGMQLELLLQLPGEATPITISNAAVRWTGSHGIGVEFLTVAPPHQERLNRVVEQLSAKVGQA
ncbi:MAG: PilZ domain-containing protein [Nitrospirae bacterium]|nr:PilZ domain-containing protein [Nitrospirota bacterium]